MVDLTLAELAGYERRAAKTVLLDVPEVEGEVLKFARKALGLKQAELAAILDVSAETISRWETSADPFKRQVQLAYAQLLDIAEHHGPEAIRHLLMSPTVSERPKAPRERAELPDRLDPDGPTPGPQGCTDSLPSEPGHPSTAS